MAEKRTAYRVLARKPKVNRLLGRPRHVWEGNGKTNLKEVQWEGDWTEFCLAVDRVKWWILVNMIVNCDFHEMW